MRETLLLVEKSSHCLSYYDTETGERLKTVALPDFPHEFVLNREKTIAYIGIYGVVNSGSPDKGGHSVVALDVASGTILHTLDLGAENNRPHGLDMDGEGRLYVMAEGSSELLVWDTPETQGLYSRQAPSGGEKSHLFALAKDGRKAYSINLDSNDVTLFDPFDPSLKPIKIETGERPEGRLLRGDEKVLFVTTRTSETLAAIDTKSLKVVAEVSCPGDPVRVFHDTKRNRLMTINYGSKSIGIFDDETLAVVDRIELTHAPIALSFDAVLDRAFLSVDDNKLHIVNLDTLEILKTIQTFDEPDVSATVQLPESAPVFASRT